MVEDPSIGEGGSILIPVGGCRWSGLFGRMVDVDDVVEVVDMTEPSCDSVCAGSDDTD